MTITVMSTIYSGTSTTGTQAYNQYRPLTGEDTIKAISLNNQYAWVAVGLVTGTQAMGTAMGMIKLFKSTDGGASFTFNTSIGGVDFAFHGQGDYGILMYTNGGIKYRILYNDGTMSTENTFSSTNGTGYDVFVDVSGYALVSYGTNYYTINLSTNTISSPVSIGTIPNYYVNSLIIHNTSGTYIGIHWDDGNDPSTTGNAHFYNNGSGWFSLTVPSTYARQFTDYNGLMYNATGYAPAGNRQMVYYTSSTGGSSWSAQQSATTRSIDSPNAVPNANNTQSELSIYSNAAGTLQRARYNGTWQTPETIMTHTTGYSIRATATPPVTAFMGKRFVVFIESNTGDSTCKINGAYEAIPWNSAPNIPSSVSTNATYYNNSSTFTLSWTYSDPEGDNSASYHLVGSKDNWATWSYDSGEVASVATSGSTMSRSIACSTLAEGTWRWAVMVKDTYGTWSTDWGFSSVVYIDKTPPTASGGTTTPQYLNVAAGGTFRVQVTGVSDAFTGVTDVKFPTWTSANGQDDLIWYDQTTTAKPVNAGSGTWYMDVPIANHGNAEGLYYTDVYGYDASGNNAVIRSVQTTIDRSAPTYSNASVGLTPESVASGGTKNVSIDIADSITSAYVYDLWYTTPDNVAHQSNTNVLVSSGATRTYPVPITTTGTYLADFYVKDTAGNQCATWPIRLTFVITPIPELATTSTHTGTGPSAVTKILAGAVRMPALGVHASGVNTATFHTTPSIADMPSSSEAHASGGTIGLHVTLSPKVRVPASEAHASGGTVITAHITLSPKVRVSGASEAHTSGGTTINVSPYRGLKGSSAHASGVTNAVLHSIPAPTKEIIATSGQLTGTGPTTVTKTIAAAVRLSNAYETHASGGMIGSTVINGIPAQDSHTSGGTIGLHVTLAPIKRLPTNTEGHAHGETTGLHSIPAPIDELSISGQITGTNSMRVTKTSAAAIRISGASEGHSHGETGGLHGTLAPKVRVSGATEAHASGGTVQISNIYNGVKASDGHIHGEGGQVHYLSLAPIDELALSGQITGTTSVAVTKTSAAFVRITGATDAHAHGESGTVHFASLAPIIRVPGNTEGHAHGDSGILHPLRGLKAADAHAHGGTERLHSIPAPIDELALSGQITGTGSIAVTKTAAAFIRMGPTADSHTSTAGTMQMHYQSLAPTKRLPASEGHAAGAQINLPVIRSLKGSDGHTHGEGGQVHYQSLAPIDELAASGQITGTGSIVVTKTAAAIIRITGATGGHSHGETGGLHYQSLAPTKRLPASEVHSHGDSAPLPVTRSLKGTDIHAHGESGQVHYQSLAPMDELAASGQITGTNSIVVQKTAAAIFRIAGSDGHTHGGTEHLQVILAAVKSTTTTEIHSITETVRLSPFMALRGADSHGSTPLTIQLRGPASPNDEIFLSANHAITGPNTITKQVAATIRISGASEAHASGGTEQLHYKSLAPILDMPSSTEAHASGGTIGLPIIRGLKATDTHAQGGTEHLHSILAPIDELAASGQITGTAGVQVTKQVAATIRISGASEGHAHGETGTVHYLSIAPIFSVPGTDGHTHGDSGILHPLRGLKASEAHVHGGTEHLHSISAPIDELAASGQITSTGPSVVGKITLTPTRLPAIEGHSSGGTIGLHTTFAPIISVQASDGHTHGDSGALHPIRSLKGSETHLHGETGQVHYQSLAPMDELATNGQITGTNGVQITKRIAATYTLPASEAHAHGGTERLHVTLAAVTRVPATDGHLHGETGKLSPIRNLHGTGAHIEAGTEQAHLTLAPTDELAASGQITGTAGVQVTKQLAAFVRLSAADNHTGDGTISPHVIPRPAQELSISGQMAGTGPAVIGKVNAPFIGIRATEDHASGGTEALHKLRALPAVEGHASGGTIQARTTLAPKVRVPATEAHAGGGTIGLHTTQSPSVRVPASEAHASGGTIGLHATASTFRISASEGHSSGGTIGLHAIASPSVRVPATDSHASGGAIKMSPIRGIPATEAHTSPVAVGLHSILSTQVLMTAREAHASTGTIGLHSTPAPHVPMQGTEVHASGGTVSPHVILGPIVRVPVTDNHAGGGTIRLHISLASFAGLAGDEHHTSGPFVGISAKRTLPALDGHVHEGAAQLRAQRSADNLQAAGGHESGAVVRIETSAPVISLRGTGSSASGNDVTFITVTQAIPRVRGAEEFHVSFGRAKLTAIAAMDGMAGTDIHESGGTVHLHSFPAVKSLRVTSNHASGTQGTMGVIPAPTPALRASEGHTSPAALPMSASKPMRATGAHAGGGAVTMSVKPLQGIGAHASLGTVHLRSQLSIASLRAQDGHTSGASGQITFTPVTNHLKATGAHAQPVRANLTDTDGIRTTAAHTSGAAVQMRVTSSVKGVRASEVHASGGTAQLHVVSSPKVRMTSADGHLHSENGQLSPRRGVKASEAHAGTGPIVLHAIVGLKATEAHVSANAVQSHTVNAPKVRVPAADMHASGGTAQAHVTSAPVIRFRASEVHSTKEAASLPTTHNMQAVVSHRVQEKPIPLGRVFNVQAHDSHTHSSAGLMSRRKPLKGAGVHLHTESGTFDTSRINRVYLKGQRASEVRELKASDTPNRELAGSLAPDRELKASATPNRELAGSLAPDRELKASEPPIIYIRGETE